MGFNDRRCVVAFLKNTFRESNNAGKTSFEAGLAAAANEKMGMAADEKAAAIKAEAAKLANYYLRTS